MGKSIETPRARIANLLGPIEIKLDREKTRGQLITALSDWALWMEPPQMMLALQPKEIYHKSKQDYLFRKIETNKKVEAFFTPPCPVKDKEEAISILSDMGFESVETEEALTFGLYQKFWWYVSGSWKTVVLSAQYIRPGSETNPEFLTFSKGAASGGVVKLHTFESFSHYCNFLVKRKTQHRTVEEFPI